MIGLGGEDAPDDFAVGGGEEDFRHLEMEPGVLLCSAVMEGFIIGAAPVSCTTPRLKQDKRDKKQR